MSNDDPDAEPLTGEVLENTAPTRQLYPAPYSNKDPEALTVKQLKFATAVLSGMSVSDAYKSAYDTSKMNPKTIYQRGWQLTNTHGKVKSFIEAGKAKIVQKTQIDKSWVLERLALNAEIAAGLKTQKLKRVINGEVVDIEAHFPDRAAANRGLELIGKEAGMFVDRREVGQPGDFARLDDQALRLALVEAMQAFVKPTE